jgi:hypothetical protein
MARIQQVIVFAGCAVLSAVLLGCTSYIATTATVRGRAFVTSSDGRILNCDATAGVPQCWTAEQRSASGGAQ